MADRIIRETDGGVTLREPIASPFDAKTLGDGDIIRATKQITNPSGLTQFRITLPSGREVESEWLREEQLKKALLPWIETIRAEMQADADEVRAIARRQSEERKAGQPKGPVLVSPSGDALIVGPEPSGVRQSSRPMPPLDTPVAPSSTSGAAPDPTAFAKQGLETARQAERYWADQANKATSAWSLAIADVDRWERIVAALGGPAHDTSSVQHEETGSSVPVSGNTGRKRGRPAGSKNRPKPSISPAGEPYIAS